MTKVKFLENHSGLGYVAGEVADIDSQYASTFEKLGIVEIISEGEIKDNHIPFGIARKLQDKDISSTFEKAGKKLLKENALANVPNIENAALD